MTLAVLSDVHGNYQALQAVLHDVRERGVNEIFFLGDAVGYGPQPGECLRVLEDVSSEVVVGNHDHAAIGLTDIDYFNPVARMAIIWTAGMLTAEEEEVLASWPLASTPEGRDMFLVHGTPYEPEKWYYLRNAQDAARAFKHFDQRLCLVGHSHVPLIAELAKDGEIYGYEGEVIFREGARYIVNVGSVGQPRDRDPRAAYALVDKDVVSIVRVQYNINATQLLMADAGLPEPLIERLSYGI